jgi:uncharacterized protein (DUF1499 family)
MLRRLAYDDPPSRLALWSRRFALFSLVVALIAIILVRGGFVEAIAGVAVLGSALVIAAIAMLLALGAFVVIWIHGSPGFGRALTALFIGVALTSYPAYVLARGYPLPAISDITTDMADPPRFEAIARLRSRGANPVNYPGGDVAQRQREAYPDIAPMALAASVTDAYEGALEVITARKWRIVDVRTPQGGRRDGRIEAVALTTIMGFRDDVVVRVRAVQRGSRIDIRSASRYGKHDLGSNARRIRSLIEEIGESVETQPAAKR